MRDGDQISEVGGQRSAKDSRLRTRRARALSRQEATSCQGGRRSEIRKKQRDGWMIRMNSFEIG